MIAKIAVSAATYAIDKPYSYKIPEGMTLQPGQRVQLPFGRANKRTEGVVLTVETGSEEKLKAVDGKCLIKCASVEFMSFIEDVYRSLHRREY